MIRTIVFDFGNVVAFFDHGRAVAKLAPFTDMDPVELALAIYGSPIADDYECGRLTTREFFREVALNGRLRCSAPEFFAAYTDIFWPNSELASLLGRLKPQYRLVLASNTNEAHYLRYTRDYADLLAHFDHLVPSHHAGARKPHVEFYAYVQQFTQAEPRECLFLDDLPVNIEAAERFGWQGLVYTCDGTVADKLAAHGIQMNPAVDTTTPPHTAGRSR